MKLRDYQRDLTDRIYGAWDAGHRNVLAVAPCRSGKTVTFTNMSNGDPNPSCVQVHRQELIGQIVETHALLQVPHNIIAPQPVINFCIKRQIKATGRSYYDAKAPAAIAGVDTLIRRFDETDRWPKTVQRWTTDEGHHVRADNKWGKGVALFPNAWGLGVTATPIRGDNKSLHREQGGVFDALVQSIDMRTLIGRGRIRDYRVIAPKPSIDEAILKIGTTGEFTEKSVKEATEGSQIVGDTVQTYSTHTPGKQAIAFAADVKQSKDLAAKFVAAGVRAEHLDGTTPDAQRQAVMDRFMAGDIQVLTNCDLFSEGLDLPGVDVCIMCRPTNSFGMFVQQFCRPLTPAFDGDTAFGIIIDQCGNVLRMAAKYGMPDTPRRWELFRDDFRKKTADDAIPYSSCPQCLMAYERTHRACPFCGFVPEPMDRGVPAMVDGVLAEMSPELLAQLRAARAQVDAAEPPIPYSATDAIVRSKLNQHREKQMAQHALREAMDFWGGVREVEGDSDAAMQVRFFHRFGLDVYSAQALPAKKAEALRQEIMKDLT